MLIDKSKKGKNKTGKILRWKLLNKKNYFKTQLKIWYFYLHTIIVFGYFKKKKKTQIRFLTTFLFCWLFIFQPHNLQNKYWFS